MTRRESAVATSGAAKVASALKSAPPALDDLTRARMERRLLDAPRDRVSRPVAKLDRRGRAVWAAGGAVVAAAAALAIGWIVWPRGVPGTEEAPVARFTIDGPGEGASGEVRVGGSLEVGAGEHASVQVGHADVDLAGIGAGGRGEVRFASLDARDVRLELSSGEVEVAFHPVERGRERLTVETPSARVEVVGTVFSVRIEGGATRVAVSEGIVRVVPHGAEASAVMVRAGESVAVEREGQAARVESSEVEAGTEAGTEIATEAETGTVAGAETGTVGVAVAGSSRRRARGAVEPVPVPVVAVPPTVPEYDPAPAVVEPPAVVPVPPRARLAAGRAQVEQGHHAAGRDALAAIVRDRSVALDIRTEAQSLIGDSLGRQGDLAGAIAAYERAAQLGAGRDEGANAIFALARLYQRQQRVDDARRTYLRYLEEAPLGPNRRQARDWICGHGGDPSVQCGGGTP